MLSLPEFYFCEPAAARRALRGEERDRVIVAKVAAGAKVKRVALDYGLSVAQVYKLVRKFGGTRALQSVLRDAEIVRERDRGVRVATLSSRYELTGATIRRILKSASDHAGGMPHE